MIIQHVNNKSFCWVQRQSKLVWRMFTFFVVGFVNNSDFFIFLEKKNQNYVYIYFVLHRKKCLVWILQSGCVIFADCCYHDASCMLWKQKTKKRKNREKKRSIEKTMKKRLSSVLYRLFTCTGRITANKTRSTRLETHGGRYFFL